MDQKTRKSRTQSVARRQFLRRAGALVAAAPFVDLLGCSSDTGSPSDVEARNGASGNSNPGTGANPNTNPGQSPTAQPTGTGGPVPGDNGPGDNGPGDNGPGGGDGGGGTKDPPMKGDAGAPSRDSGTKPDSGGVVVVGWASGGTKSMRGNYPDPFTKNPTSCTFAFDATEGPCTEIMDRVRRDVSEGNTGLPMRLAFRLVDRACKPMAGAKVKIWHTSAAGSYSGDTPDNAFCVIDPSGSTKHYFRGVQVSDANGRVDFDTCFPGWYPIRAIHIHVTITINGKSTTNQVLFDQGLIDEIFRSHPDYKMFGPPATSNAADSAIPKGVQKANTLETSRLYDGALMAAKVITILT
jgi:hypothetical protein